jgi:DNA-directed RNA polymerase specialized sigma24 family protein
MQELGTQEGHGRVEAVLEVHQPTDEQLAAEAAREGSGGVAFAALVERFRQDAPPAGLGLDLGQMLETLDEEDRAMVILKYAEDYSYEELAEIFELSVSACKMRVSRAREKLQERYGQQNQN